MLYIIAVGDKAWEAASSEVKEETGISKVLLYTSKKFDQIYSPRENYIYVAPVLTKRRYRDLLLK